MTSCLLASLHKEKKPKPNPQPSTDPGHAFKSSFPRNIPAPCGCLAQRLDTTHCSFHGRVGGHPPTLTLGSAEEEEGDVEEKDDMLHCCARERWELGLEIRAGTGGRSAPALHPLPPTSPGSPPRLGCTAPQLPDHKTQGFWADHCYPMGRILLLRAVPGLPSGCWTRPHITKCCHAAPKSSCKRKAKRPKPAPTPLGN